MEGRAQQGGINLEPGVHTARLKEVYAYQAKRYQSDEDEPVLFLVWDFGPDESGRARTLRDSFVRLPLTHDGFPAMNDRSKLYNRLSAVYGQRFAVEQCRWTLGIQEPYDSPEGLQTLPHWDDRERGDSAPARVESITVDDVELIGGAAYVEVATRGDYLRIVSANPMPKGADTGLPF